MTLSCQNFYNQWHFYSQILHKHTCNTYHGLYGSTSCCISHAPSQWIRAIFDPHSSDTPGPIFMKLERDPHENFRGLRRRGWFGQRHCSQFDAWKFLSFFSFFRHVHRSHLWTHPTHNTSLCVVLAKVVPFGSKEDEIWMWPLYPQKT